MTHPEKQPQEQPNDDAARMRFIERLQGHDEQTIRHLLGIEHDHELIELKRVAIEAQYFEVAVYVKREMLRRGVSDATPPANPPASLPGSLTAKTEPDNSPSTVAARRISCHASCGRGITEEEAKHYIDFEFAARRDAVAQENAFLRKLAKEEGEGRERANVLLQENAKRVAELNKEIEHLDLSNKTLNQITSHQCDDIDRLQADLTAARQETLAAREELARCEMAVDHIDAAAKDLLAKANLRAETAEKLYHELIYCVGRKYPNETRHETAYKYLLRAEEPCGTAASTPAKPHELNASAEGEKT